jgi:hypothetical protein
MSSDAFAGWLEEGKRYRVVWVEGPTRSEQIGQYAGWGGGNGGLECFRFESIEADGERTWIRASAIVNVTEVLD